MRRLPALAMVCLAHAAPLLAQASLQGYDTPALEGALEAVSRLSPEQRSVEQLTELLPLARPTQFVEFIRATRAPTARAFRDILGEVDAARLNKMLAGGPASGGTGLVTGVVAPAVVSAAVEYGDILQEQAGTVTTLRTNALGLARFLFGAEQFPQCPVLTDRSCHRPSRRLRAISGAVSLENTTGASPSAAVTDQGMTSLPSDDYRVRAWGLRVDLTPSNSLDDPIYVEAWTRAIETLAQAPEAAQLTSAVEELFSEAAAADDSVYIVWQEHTLELLRAAPTDAVRGVLAERLVMLIGLMQAADPAFAERVNALARAYADYDAIRRRMLLVAQTHKMSLEFTSRRPIEQPRSSNLRFVYSHQPSVAPAILTLNAALSWYHDRPSASGRLRDIQIAGQVDRRLGDALSFGRAVLTLAGYYQWMRDDALLALPDARPPGTGLVLPEGTQSILGTKGHIGVLQGKISFAIAESVKVPLSVTWATRRELIAEKDVRAQIGLTLDLDQLTH